MNTKRKIINCDLNTIKGLDKAEKLLSRGWSTGPVGFNTVAMYKDINVSFKEH
jgi:hypothetical protein